MNWSFNLNYYKVSIFLAFSFAAMSVTREHLDKLCTLAALNLTDEQKDRFVPQLDAIVTMVSKLETLEITDSAEMDSQFVSHTNHGVVASNEHILDNVRHPIVGNMPSISFTTRGEW